jgi:hypothetical protein
MAIQPGPGYTFTSSSLGTNLNIQQPWSDWQPVADQTILQFQVTASITGAQVRVQLAKGAVNYSQSTMPAVWLNPHTNVRQCLLKNTSVRPSISAVDGGTASSPWMENGGYYVLPGAGFYYVAISKPDFDGGNTDGGISNSLLMQQNRPFVSIFSSESYLYYSIFDETGPSMYVNMTNLQRMDGYDAESTDLDADWGACHTTWFNPVKYGYACKIIATIEVTGAGPTLAANVAQHVVGSIDMAVPLQFYGTSLRDVAGETEEDDPYNVNEEAGFIHVVNHQMRTNMNSLPVAVATGYYLDMLGPADWTQTDFYLWDDCTGVACKHPFEVKRSGMAESIVWSICEGTVNNITPDPAFDTFTMEDGFVWLRVMYDDTSGSYPFAGAYGVIAEHGPTVPADTDNYGHIVIAEINADVVTQLVTGSLWSDRLKLGTATATYYFARV